MLHGDPASEVFLHEIVRRRAATVARDLNVESVYEYGARRWLLYPRLFIERGLTLTVYAVGMALERNRQRDGRWSRPGSRWPATAGAGSTITMCPSMRSAPM